MILCLLSMLMAHCGTSLCSQQPHRQGFSLGVHIMFQQTTFTITSTAAH